MAGAGHGHEKRPLVSDVEPLVRAILAPGINVPLFFEIVTAPVSISRQAAIVPNGEIQTSKVSDFPSDLGSPTTEDHAIPACG